eukprot:CAMPEP_0194715014 /NCGR_PEP_ID=MMETSP0296-20130528/6706_1 /TAXON_ID=39354 /ORGANISM="Heterosigma akashiwo, Strain CCMP2393" /LENGTH=119 /DNA_ID=CAMNT_0039614555 /DNA_START=539 /DNA_END=895 /DNA_ORIENTATION=+
MWSAHDPFYSPDYSDCTSNQGAELAEAARDGGGVPAGPAGLHAALPDQARATAHGHHHARAVGQEEPGDGPPAAERQRGRQAGRAVPAEPVQHAVEEHALDAPRLGQLLLPPVAVAAAA